MQAIAALLARREAPLNALTGHSYHAQKAERFQNPCLGFFVGLIVIQMVCTVVFRDAGNSSAIGKT